MCGIASLQLRDPALRGSLGELMHGMLCGIVDRGLDSAGMALYGDPGLTPTGTSTVTLLDVTLEPEELAAALRGALPAGTEVAVRMFGETTLVNASVASAALEACVAELLPTAHVAGRGEHVAVLKGTGHPLDLAAQYGLEGISGSQGLSHTRMATESAVTASGAHPFTVADDLCLVHNGSFSNHATIRRQLRAEGVTFDSENDSEVAARYIAWRMADGDSLTTALEKLGTVFDGFYTLVVTTPTSMAVVRDPIACKPAIIAETDAWVAMASEYRALAHLPGIENARIFEPAPGIVYTWTLDSTKELVTL
ncbi:glutamine amidotransferase [Cryobacterium melibiosiphilum]|uniref:Glutamine amidotransferase n=1 Tax=Cryobacterium melibiosiphilum TaxID=995039 RepID=A0A3A5MEP7_9MICO|nr:glutamine amidotransferase [Cryobacterium melibiosiphilum]RJT88610.1 glutamine amidotransferase [Cryobacterium melibiosiphilum]